MVSIIIPCYNIQNYIEQTIKSVISQTDTNWEIIAVDDGSCDQTLRILKNFERLYKNIRVFHQQNTGVSSARNFGLSKANGNWIYFLDGDDLMLSDLVETINSCSVTNDLLVLDFIREKEGKTIRTYKISNPNTLYIDYLTNRQTIHVSSIVTKKNFLLSNNIFFDEFTSYGEDREFIAKVFACNPVYKCIKKIAFRYQYRADSAVNNRTYNTKRFTSVLASERTYKLQKDPKAKLKALSILAFNVARQLKKYYEFNCSDVEIKNQIERYVDLYLKGFHYYGGGHIEIYTTIAGIMAFNKHLLRFFLKLT